MAHNLRAYISWSCGSTFLLVCGEAKDHDGKYMVEQTCSSYGSWKTETDRQTVEEMGGEEPRIPVALERTPDNLSSFYWPLLLKLLNFPIVPSAGDRVFNIGGLEGHLRTKSLTHHDTNQFMHDIHFSMNHILSIFYFLKREKHCGKIKNTHT